MSSGVPRRWDAVTSVASSTPAADAEPSTEPSIRGVYAWGGVGVGKTMLMDLFVAVAPRQFRVHRTHFHDFMLDVHQLLRDASGEQVRRRARSHCCPHFRIPLMNCVLVFCECILSLRAAISAISLSCLPVVLLVVASDAGASAAGASDAGLL